MTFAYLRDLRDLIFDFLCFDGRPTMKPQNHFIESSVESLNFLDQEMTSVPLVDALQTFCR